jgi:hypothetical protein
VCGEQAKLRSRRRRKGKNAVRLCVTAFRRHGVSSHKVLAPCGRILVTFTPHTSRKQHVYPQKIPHTGPIFAKNRLFSLFLPKKRLTFIFLVL